VLSHEDEKNKILSGLMTSMAVGGIIAFIPSVYYSFVTGLYLLVVIDTIGYGAILAVAFIPGFRYIAKLWTVVLVCLIIGISVLFSTGVYGAGYIWLVAGIVLSSLFGRSSITVAAFFFSAIALAAYGISLGFGLDGRGMTPAILSIVGTNLLVVCVTISLVIHRIQGGLERSISERITLSDDLAAQLAESRKMRDKLTDALEVKERLLKELHHRVNNNMQLILSLMDLEPKEAAGSDSKIRRRIRALSAVNDVVLSDQNAEGAELLDIVRAVVDSATEHPGALQNSDPNPTLNRSPIFDGKSRFLPPQASVMTALCITELLASNLYGCGDPFISITDDGAFSCIQYVFPSKTDAERIRRESERLTRGTIALASEGIISFSFLPPLADSGPGIAININKRIFIRR